MQCIKCIYRGVLYVFTFSSASLSYLSIYDWRFLVSTFYITFDVTRLKKGVEEDVVISKYGFAIMTI